MTKIGRKCDRCGTITTSFRQIEAVKNPGKEIEEFTVLGDLCPVCLNELKKWMNGGKTNMNLRGDKNESKN